MPDSTVRSHSGASVNPKWVERLERFTASNQTVAAFCTAEGVGGFEQGGEELIAELLDLGR